MNSAIQSSLRPLLPLSLVAALTACGSTPGPAPETRHSGRYSIQQDRAPSRQLHPAAIPDVVPQPLHRTRAGNASPYTVLGRSYTVMPTEAGYSERGVASWYGEKFHGHKTSNGEIFDMYKVSAAHKSLPIPSYLRVTNLDNNRSIVVRVNDRGPFHGDRIVDLSYAAAVKLGYADRGTARVQLDAIVVNFDAAPRILAANSVSAAIRDPAVASRFLQVGAFSNLGTAQQLLRELNTLTDRPVFIRSINSRDNGILHRVRIGPIDNDGEMQTLSRRVLAANLGRPYTVSE